MRYSKEHKQTTRERIIQAAGRRFQGDGIDGSGVSALMADVGLTNGAFNTHLIGAVQLSRALVDRRTRGRVARPSGQVCAHVSGCRCRTAPGTWL